MAAPDKITLDNLTEKLQPWTPNDENHLYAIVDMGSNGIRFSITSLQPPNTRLLRPVYATRAGISLFDRLTPSPVGPVFSSNTISQVADTLSYFYRLSVMHGVPRQQFLILATEAMRVAANAEDMLTAIGKATNGLGLSILEPAVETLFGAVMGSRSGLVNVDRGGLFLDLGGGSVQMTWVDTSKKGYEIDAAGAGVSLPFGAAKLIKILQNEPPEVQATKINELRSGLSDAYARLCQRFPALQAIKTAYEKGQDSLVNVYMCGGGFRGYGSMLMHNDVVSPYPIGSINTYTASGELFKKAEEMGQINEAEAGKIFGLSKRRREQFPAIVTVVQAVIAAVPNIKQVTFCGGSNREGALMMKLPREIRESNPLDILAGVTDERKPVFDAILRKLSDSLPNEVDFSNIPTILNSGLGSLFIREIWIRQGHEADSNTSYALNHAINGHAETPGLTHLARALLALTSSARWGGGLGPHDAKLSRGLAGILQAQHRDAPFWAAYIGAVAGAISTLVPLFPHDATELETAIRIESRLEKSVERKDKVILTIGVSSHNAAGINLGDLTNKIEEAAKKIGEKKPKIKISAQVIRLS